VHPAMLCLCSVLAAEQPVTLSFVLHTSTDAREYYALGADTPVHGGDFIWYEF